MVLVWFKLTIFKLLLENNSNPNLISNDGYNIFVYCIIYERNKFMDYLLINNYNIQMQMSMVLFYYKFY